MNNFFGHVDALPDGVVFGLAVCAVFFALWLTDPDRKAKRNIKEIEQVIALRKSLRGWNPPEQKHARNKKEAA